MSEGEVPTISKQIAATTAILIDAGEVGVASPYAAAVEVII